MIEAKTEADLTNLIRSPNVLLDDLSAETKAQLVDIGKRPFVLMAESVITDLVSI